MFKTGIAVVLALYVSQWLSLNPVLFVVIAAVMTTQPSIYKSYLHLLEQIQANAIGAVLGVVGYWLIGNEPVVIGIVVVVVILVNLLLKFESSIGLSIVTVVIVMDAPEGALNRFLLIMTGVLIALIVNAIILPPNHEKYMLEHIRNLNFKILPLLRLRYENAIDHLYIRKESIDISRELGKVRELFKLYREEKSFFRKHRKQKVRKIVVYRKLLETMEIELQLIRSLRKQGGQDFESRLQEHLAALAQYHEVIFLKLEGKIHAKTTQYQNISGTAEHLRVLEELLPLDKVPTASDLRPVVTSSLVIELSEHLEQLEMLVNNYLRSRKR